MAIVAAGNVHEVLAAIGRNSRRGCASCSLLSLSGRARTQKRDHARGNTAQPSAANQCWTTVNHRYPSSVGDTLH